MKKKNVMKGTALALISAMGVQSVNWAPLSVHAEESRTNVDSKLAYFVDCGDYDVTTLSAGDLFGQYNSVTDQAYQADVVTGKKWGIVDSVSNPLKNGTAPNAAITDAAYTDNTLRRMQRLWMVQIRSQQTGTQRTSLKMELQEIYIMHLNFQTVHIRLRCILQIHGAFPRHRMLKLKVV